MGGWANPALHFLESHGEFTLFASNAKTLSRDQQGVSSVEYALLACLIAVFCVLTITAVGTQTVTLYEVICNGVALATGQAAC